MREFLGETGLARLCALVKQNAWEAVANSRLDGVTLESVAITAPPEKTGYAPGETFDPAGMAVRALFSNGQTAYIRTDNLTFAPDGPLENGTGEVTVGFQFGKDTAYARQEITTAYHIYGARWDGSSGRWTRTDGAAGFADPVPYTAGAGTYGSPFDGLQPWAGMVSCQRAGGAMVAIPKFWYRLTQEGAGMTVRIADGPAEGFVPSPAHMDRGDGQGERDVVYIGRYHSGENGLKSESGVLPKTGIRRPEARTAAHALGDGVWLSDFAMRFTLWLLYLVEFADWNSQSAIGYGCGDGAAVGNTGYTDAMPYHTGTMHSSRTQYGLGTQYRNIEGLWDNVQEWCDGCYHQSDGLYVIQNPSQSSESVNGVLAGLPADGYPSAFTVSDTAGFPLFYSAQSQGSESAAGCDYWGYRGTYKTVFAGGSYSQTQEAGLFCVRCTSAGGYSAVLGARLQELP